MCEHERELQYLTDRVQRLEETVDLLYRSHGRLEERVNVVEDEVLSLPGGQA